MSQLIKYECVINLNSPVNYETIFDLVIDWGSLPQGTNVYVAFEQLEDKLPVAADPKDLDNLGIVVISDDREELFKKTVEYGYGEEKHLDLNHIYRVSHTQEVQDSIKTSTIPSIVIFEDAPLFTAIKIMVPDQPEHSELYFAVMQNLGTQIIGGSTYLLHHQKGG